MTAASVVGICNSGLAKLGASLIVSLDDDTKSANLCKEQYDKQRLSLLRRANWNFAVKRAKLAQLTADPAFGFLHAYQLPPDHVRTVALYDNDAGRGAVAYRMEGGRVLSDAGELYLRYIADVTDPALMDPLFREALAYQLAQDLASALTQSSTIRAEMTAGLRATIGVANSIDAIEDFPESFPDSDWIAVRS